MISQELKRLKTTPRDLRQFGLVVGGALAALALWFWLRHKPYAWYLLVPAVPLIGLGLMFPTCLRRVYVGWMALAMVLGHVMSTLLLVVFFYLVVTPIGLLARSLGKDFLNRKWDAQTGSYWLPRNPAKPHPKSDYERQF